MEPDPAERDPLAVARLAVLAFAIALNVWLRWDTPEFTIVRRRVSGWLDRTFAAPARRARELRLLEGETVFEAMKVVEDAGT